MGHPFNPVYLLPLVELVDGERTSADTITAAAAFYTAIGMHALHEIPGHLTDRLQETLWREILRLVNDGVATTGELDESIIYGPGAALGGHGHEHDLSTGQRGSRHAAHAAPARPVPQLAVDPARGARTHRAASLFYEGRAALIGERMAAPSLRFNGEPHLSPVPGSPSAWEPSVLEKIPR